MRKGLLSGAAVVLLAAVGCSSDKGAPTPPPSPKAVSHPRAPLPRDRDPRAVTAALTRLDACTLIDPTSAHSRLFPPTTAPIANGPHQCTLTNAAFDELSVTLGERDDDRFDEGLLLLDGSKAYRPHYGCQLDVPVSFTTVIALRAQGHGDRQLGRCEETLRQFGTVLIRALHKPAPATRPMSGWDACTAVRQILDPPPRRLAPFGYGGIDGCGIDDKHHYEPTLALSYGREPVDQERFATTRIGGHQVRIYQDHPYCDLAWSQGSSGVAENPRQVVEVRANCNRARTIAAGAMRILLKPAPKPAVRPQQPLTYRETEPDVAAAGGCADYADPGDLGCAPYYPVRVPHGSKNVVRAAQADPNVQCAVALAAVRKYFGAQLRPIVTTPPNSRCAFVEPDHGVVVTVAVGASPPGTSITVAGHGGSIMNPESPGDPYSIDLALGDENDLRMTVQYLAPRGSHDVGNGVPAPKPVPLRAIAADILKRYFT